MKILALILLTALPAFGQSKDTAKVKTPEIMTLNVDKLQSHFQELQRDLDNANKQIEAWTTTRDQIMGKLQAIVDLSKYQAADTVKAKKK